MTNYIKLSSSKRLHVTVFVPNLGTDNEQSSQVANAFIVAKSYGDQLDRASISRPTNILQFLGTFGAWSVDTDWTATLNGKEIPRSDGAFLSRRRSRDVQKLIYQFLEEIVNRLQGKTDMSFDSEKTYSVSLDWAGNRTSQTPSLQRLVIQLAMGGRPRQGVKSSSGWPISRLTASRTIDNSSARIDGRRPDRREETEMVQ